MSIKKNVAYNTILSVSNVAFPVITVPYVSRILGVENIGVVNFAVAYASYFVLFAALGIPRYGIREIAKHNNSDPEKRHQVFSELFVINVISTIIFSLVYLLTVFSVPALSEEKEFLLITGVSLLFAPFNVDWFFSGREKFKLVTIRSLLAKLLSLGGLFIFVRTREDIIPYLLLTVIANLSSQIWNFGYMLRKEVKLRLKHLQLRKHLNGVLVLFASGIAFSIYTMLSTLLLGFMSDYTQVGYYTSALKVSNIIRPIVISMSPVMVARINTIKGEQNSREQITKLLNNSFGYMMMLAVPTTIGLMVVSPRFVPFFFGAEFIPATASLQLVALVIILTGLINYFGGQVLIGMGYEKKYLIAVLVGVASSLLLNTLLISRYGALGGAFTTVITEIIAAIILIVFAQKIIHTHLLSKRVYQPILAASPIILISFLFSRVIAHDLTYLVATVVTGGLTYISMMIFIFKNEQAKQITYSIIKKIGL
jgi:O-antigen/teichoic acid export membrane protein